MTNPETQIATFFARYEPAIANLGKALRAKLRARFPGLLELVYMYENQNAFVISYSPSEAGADGICGIALYPREVKVFLAGGDALSKSDPKGLLQGKGKAARYLAVSSIAEFDRPEIETLIAAALKIKNLRLDPKAKGSIVIKAEEQKQRAARAKKAARP